MCWPHSGPGKAGCAIAIFRTARAFPGPRSRDSSGTLIRLGYLRRDPSEKGRYLLGFGLLTLGYPLLASMQLRQMARPLMMQLAREIEGAVSLVIRDGIDMLYVETARVNEALPTHPDIGSKLPMLSTAAGRAWLCGAPARERAGCPEQPARQAVCAL